jgi:hypothetical protein
VSYPVVDDTTDLFSLTRCSVTAAGLPIHVHGNTAEMWMRCQCGAKTAAMVDGKLVVSDAHKVTP